MAKWDGTIRGPCQSKLMGSDWNESCGFPDSFQCVRASRSLVGLYGLGSPRRAKIHPAY